MSPQEPSSFSSSSPFHSVLSSGLQSRLPRLPSFRTALGSSLKPMRRSSSEEAVPAQDMSSRPSSSSSHCSGTSTPPPDYTTSTSMCEPGSIVKLQPQTPPQDMYQAPNGISWAYAAQGLALLRVCFQQQTSEEEPPAPNSSNTSSLTRNLYVHSLTYLLRALPATLSLDERTSLQSALPDAVLPDATHSPPQQTTIILHRSPPSMSSPQLPQRQSLLHRLTAVVTLNLILLASVLAPYIAATLRRAYTYEQQHRLLLRAYNAVLGLLSLALSHARDAGRRGLDLSRQVCEADDGRIAGAAQQLFTSLALGITDGVCQGLGDGAGKPVVGDGGVVGLQPFAAMGFAKGFSG